MHVSYQVAGQRRFVIADDRTGRRGRRDRDDDAGQRAGAASVVAAAP
jgi:hypothetical protein